MLYLHFFCIVKVLSASQNERDYYNEPCCIHHTASATLHICECSPSLQMFGTYTQTYSFRSLKTFTAHHMHTLKIKKKT